jgi:mono/diheme cytochrome c family protein
LRLDVVNANGRLQRRRFPASGNSQRRNRHGETTCAGCHDRADPPGSLPARKLFHWARKMPPLEFAARLYAGVRGDALTARANPFGAAELAALLAYYRESHVAAARR